MQCTSCTAVQSVLRGEEPATQAPDLAPKPRSRYDGQTRTPHTLLAPRPGHAPRATTHPPDTSITHPTGNRYLSTPATPTTTFVYGVPTPQHRFSDPQKLAAGFQLAFSRTGPKTVSCSPLPVVRFGGEHNVLSLHTHHRSSQDCTCRPAVAMSPALRTNQ